MAFADWSGTNCTLALDAVTFLVGAKSMKITSSGTTWQAASTQSFGDLSAYTGAASGAPVTGTLGVWVYLAAGTEISAISLRVGSGAGNYTEVAGIYPFSGAFGAQAGWNYYVFNLKNGATTGTPAWTSVAYTQLRFTGTTGAAIYADYLSVGKGDNIANNGLGRRVMSTSYGTVGTG